MEPIVYTHEYIILPHVNVMFMCSLGSPYSTSPYSTLLHPLQTMETAPAPPCCVPVLISPARTGQGCFTSLGYQIPRVRQEPASDGKTMRPWLVIDKLLGVIEKQNRSYLKSQAPLLFCIGFPLRPSSSCWIWPLMRVNPTISAKMEKGNCCIFLSLLLEPSPHILVLSLCLACALSSLHSLVA